MPRRNRPKTNGRNRKHRDDLPPGCGNKFRWQSREQVPKYQAVTYCRRCCGWHPSKGGGSRRKGRK